MGIDDPLLPAAVHLSGPHAGDMIRPAIEQAGGTLGAHRCARLYYRPGHSLIARFRATVTGPDGHTRRETVLVATTHTGPPAGTVAVTAETPAGEVTAGVWQWPFDPGLPALEQIIRRPAAELATGGLFDATAQLAVDTVAYRPMERAVLRVSTPGTTWYLKVVGAATGPDLVARHQLLRDHGLPVPRVVAADAARGWMLVTELADPTLRTLLKSDASDWPTADTLHELTERIAVIGVGSHADLPRAFRRRLRDGPHHAALLATALPTERDRLTRLIEVIEAAVGSVRADGFVHGDLHENQLTCDAGRITGLLDIDEAGVGDPLDDIAVPVAHLRHRALRAPNAHRINSLADGLFDAASSSHAPADLGAATAAVLIGLATAPFRAQVDGWERRVGAVLDLADRAAERR